MFLIAGTTPAVAAGEPENVDQRLEFNQDFDVAMDSVQRHAAESLRKAIPELVQTHDAMTGATRTLSNRMGYLSEARSAEPMEIGLDYVRSHLDLLGLTEADLAGYEVTDNVYTAVTGATHIYLRQVHQGLSVYNAQLHMNINRDGRVLSVNNSFLPQISASVGSHIPQLDAAEAARRAAASIGVVARPAIVSTDTASARLETTLEAAEFSTRPIEAKLMWLPVRRGDARLVWNFQAFTPDHAHMYDFTVDAQSGDVWTRLDWVSDASYRVFEQPVESPVFALLPPPDDGRTLAVDPANAIASPLGWNNDGTTSYTTLRGNNVHAVDGNSQTPTVVPDCGVLLECDFHSPIDFATADPDDYASASITSLFYWANIIHDIQYQYGFDEVAGNFQENNFGNGGLGGDAVSASGQGTTGRCPNNAFFGTGPDGQDPTMTMCLWTNSTPRRDFSWDAGVLIHEYGHGISNRLVGGPSNTSCLSNTQQAGEGLSDWWSLALTGEVGDQGTDSRGAGVYILGQPISGPGVRGQPYSTDPALNTWDYERINGASVPHGLGATWAQAAWEVYWAVVDERGFDADLYNATGGSGNQRMLLYVTEGLKNTTCSPTFTDIRDGIIQAAIDNNGGEDVCLMWEAFAAFGLGSDAVSGGPDSTSPTNGFALPTVCTTLFADDFESVVP